LCRFSFYIDERDASSSGMGGVLGGDIIYVSSLFLYRDVIIYSIYTFFRSDVMHGYTYMFLSYMFKNVRCLSRSLCIDHVCSLSHLLVIPSCSVNF